MLKFLSARSYEEIIEHDLELMWSIKRFCKARPWIDQLMSRIVSKHPLQDICFVLWIVFIVGWIEVGHAHFWVCAVNACVVMLARRILEAKRPVEYDRRLRPRTEINPESYGFPSIETHMTVVIFGHLYLSYLTHHPNLKHKRFAFFDTSPFTSSMSTSTSASKLTGSESVVEGSLFALLFSSYSIATFLLFITIAMSFLVGFSRVHSASRFPHQIMGSYLTGFIGLLVGRQCCEHMAFHRMRDFEHYSCLVFVVIGLLANVAMNMENNDSRLLYIPKREFMRVICDILSSSRSGDAVLASGANVQTGPENMARMEEDDDEAEESTGARRRRGRALLSPRATALREAQDRSAFGTSGRRRVKSDSLYFLQRGLEDRERRQLHQQQQQAAAPSASLGERAGGKRGRKKYYYGAEDFYSTDNDDAAEHFS